jgi:ABC-type lipoprotein export system ATPase subunit
MLNIKGLYKTYKPKKGREVEALKDINLSLGSKGLIFLLGKSGSGKSTLMNIIGGLDVADQGEILFGDKDLTKLDPKEYDSYRNSTIGFIFQEFHLIETFSVYKNIALSLELQGKQAKREEIETLLMTLDLKDEIDRMPYELSGGQKQRVSIARALIKHPKIILADEPTGSLDSETGKQIFDVLKKLSQEQLVIVVSHDRDYAEAYGDRIVELSDGKIIKDTQKIAQDQDQLTFELTPSKMPIKDALSLGFAAFIRKPVRMIFTILLLMFAFMLFGVIDSTSNYSINETVIKYLYERNETMLVLNRTTYSILNEYDAFSPFGSSHLADLKQDYHHIYMKEVLPDRIEMNTLFNPSYHYFYYESFTSGIIEIDQTFLNESQFELVGRLPLDETEIVIPYHLYESYQAWGFDDGVKVNITSPYDLLGRKINDSKNYTVVGVLDTKFYADKYQQLFDERVTDEVKRTLERELDMISSGSLHTYMYVYPGFIEDYLDQQPDDVLIYEYAQIAIYNGTKNNPSDMNNSDAELIDGRVIRKINSYPKHTYFINDFSASSLSDNQVILPLRLFRTYYFEELENNFDALLQTQKEEVISKYAETHYDEIPPDLQSYYGIYTWEAYADRIMTNQLIINDDDITYLDFEYQAAFELSEPLFSEFGDYFSLRLQNQMSNLDYSGAQIDIDVVGYYLGYDILVSPSFFEDIIETSSKYPFKQLVIGLSGNQKDDLSLLSELDERSERFEPNNEIAHMMLYMNDPIIFFQGVLVWLGLGLAFFSGLLFYNFMSVSIHHKKKEVGILRALGARRKDVFMIFFSEALIIALIVFALSLIASYTLVTIGNNVIVDKFGLGVDLLWMKERQFFTILLMNIGVALLSSYIPIYKFAKEKPIDTIKTV